MSRSAIGSACAVSANPAPNFISSLPSWTIRSPRAQHLAASVSTGLNQRSELDRGVERVLLSRCSDEAVGVLLQHQALAHAFLAHPRHGRDVGRMARVALLDRGARVTARLALCLRPGKRHEAARVPPLFALGESGALRA